MVPSRLPLTKDTFKIVSTPDGDYMIIANFNPFEVVEQILADKEIVDRLKTKIKDQYDLTRNIADVSPNVFTKQGALMGTLSALLEVYDPKDDKLLEVIGGKDV